MYTTVAIAADAAAFFFFFIIIIIEYERFSQWKENLNIF